MYLYPRLPVTIAKQLVTTVFSSEIEEAIKASGVSHPAATYAPTGGNRVKEELLQNIQTQIREAARNCGYPDTLTDNNRRTFDATTARILHSLMDISPAEASNQAIWAFMGCVLLPDIVRWRFPGANGISASERFLGGSRGLRNTFGRVWWRAYILYCPAAPDPYVFLNLLGEDELVQITERPNLAGSPVLAQQVCKSFLEAMNEQPKVTRSDVLRDAMKRLRRLLPLISFDSLDQNVLKAVVDQVFSQSVTSLNSLSAKETPAEAVATDGSGTTPAVPEKSKKTVDPLAAAIVLHIPKEHYNCIKCGSPNQLWINKSGPVTICSNKSCGKSEAVSFQVLRNTLKELKLRCDKCKAPLTVAYGSEGQTIVCLQYPMCDYTIGWQNLREKLRAP